MEAENLREELAEAAAKARASQDAALEEAARARTFEEAAEERMATAEAAAEELRGELKAWEASRGIPNPPQSPEVATAGGSPDRLAQWYGYTPRPDLPEAEAGGNTSPGFFGGASAGDAREEEPLQRDPGFHLSFDRTLAGRGFGVTNLVDLAACEGQPQTSGSLISPRGGGGGGGAPDRASWGISDPSVAAGGGALAVKEQTERREEDTEVENEGWATFSRTTAAADRDEELRRLREEREALGAEMAELQEERDSVGAQLEEAREDQRPLRPRSVRWRGVPAPARERR